MAIFTKKLATEWRVTKVKIMMMALNNTLGHGLIPKRI